MNILPESPRIIDLRRLLRERFPAAHALAGPAVTPGKTLTSLSCFENVARGTITEVISPHPSAGNGLLIHGLLQDTARRGRYMALIDGHDAFDPQSAGLEDCGKLLWARCRSASEAVKAADLLLRDGNLEFIAMDLQLNPPSELNRLPSSSWHRLRGLAEKSGVTLIALTPQRIIPSAHLRVALDGAFALDAFDIPRDELRRKLLLRFLRSRGLHTPKASPETTERKVG